MRMYVRPTSRIIVPCQVARRSPARRDARNNQIGMVALHDGRYDVNLGFGAFLRDDGQRADAEPAEGLFTSDDTRYAVHQARDGDAGPRTIRVQAEVEAGDGRHHATALSVGTVDVEA